ncbi:esterase/lipase family protein [Maricaulis maris]|uniref:esterase/lipase family protein n=1 Tax=Maricaulis maris TaxID=74318 RepID=UPI003B8CB0C3
MSEHVLLIHGWSASDKSMAGVGELLAAKGYETSDVFLGGYPSMDDDVRIADSGRRLNAVIAEMQGDGRLPARFHVVVHSTGALVARWWMAEYFPRGGAPVANFLMLAPANFGSPLATIGRSTLGRLTKGFTNGFQTGTHFLNSLELASQFQEDLALRDRLSEDGHTESPFSESGTRPYVIVGADPIFGTGILGEKAWDGTVRVATANIDPRGVTVDFSKGSILKPDFRAWTRRGPDETPFAVIPDRSHLSILKPAPKESASKDKTVSERLEKLILQALDVKGADGYRAVIDDWTAICQETRQLAQDGVEADALRDRILGRAGADGSRFREFYQIVVEAVDDTGLPVDDFSIWLTAPKKTRETQFKAGNSVTRIEIDAQLSLIQDRHVNSCHKNRLSLHVDRRELLANFLRDRIPPSYEASLAAGITAASPGKRVGYFDMDGKEHSALIRLRALDPGDETRGKRFLKRYTTHFLRVILPRATSDDVFTARSLR